MQQRREERSLCSLVYLHLVLVVFLLGWNCLIIIPSLARSSSPSWTFTEGGYDILILQGRRASRQWACAQETLVAQHRWYIRTSCFYCCAVPHFRVVSVVQTGYYAACMPSSSSPSASGEACFVLVSVVSPGHISRRARRSHYCRETAKWD